MSGQSTALIAQNGIFLLAKQLGFNELSFILRYLQRQPVGARRLDGIMASVGYGDVVTSSFARGMVGRLTRRFISLIKILQAKLITFIHDTYLCSRQTTIWCRSISICTIQSDAVIVPSEQMQDKLLAEADCEQDFDQHVGSSLWVCLCISLSLPKPHRRRGVGPFSTSDQLVLCCILEIFQSTRKGQNQRPMSAGHGWLAGQSCSWGAGAVKGQS